MRNLLSLHLTFMRSLPPHLRTPLFIAPTPTPPFHHYSYGFAKQSKKDQDKAKDKKEKEQAKEAVGGQVKTIDLKKFEEGYERVIASFKTELDKIKIGRLEASSFSTIYVRIGSESLPISQLAQITPKNATTCVISPFAFEQIDAIQKVIKTCDLGLDVTRVEKSLSVSQPNSSAKEIKAKVSAKLQKCAADRREDLKRERTKSLDQIKKYKKIIPEDRYILIEKEVKLIFQKRSEQLNKIEKEKEKEIAK